MAIVVRRTVTGSIGDAQNFAARRPHLRNFAIECLSGEQVRSQNKSGWLDSQPPNPCPREATG